MSETITRKARVYSLETLQPTSFDVNVTVPSKPANLAEAMEAVGGNEEKVVDAVHKLIVREAVKSEKEAAVADKIANDPNVVVSIKPVRMMINALLLGETFKNLPKPEARKMALAMLRASDTIWSGLQDACRAESEPDNETDEDEDEE